MSVLIYESPENGSYSETKTPITFNNELQLEFIGKQIHLQSLHEIRQVFVRLEQGNTFDLPPELVFT